MLSKINTFLRLLVVGLLIYPMPVLADHVPTQPAYGQNLTTDNNAGTITIGILSSDGFEDSPPENYTIFFSGSSGITETNSFCVTTSFGHQTNTWQYYTFSNDDLKYYFADLSGENFYFAIRSNNETDNSVSTLTTESVYNIYAGVSFEFNQTDWSAPTGTDACNPYVVTTTTTTTTTTTIPPVVPDDATNISVNYQGKDVYFAWEYTDGKTLAKEFHINYSYDNATWERVIITDTTARTYTLDYTNIQAGTFYWTFSVCGDIENGESCTDSDSNNFETTQYVAPTTTVYVAPPPPPPPPPPTPEEIKVDIKVEGVDKEYTQADVNDGTIERDQERVDNEKEYGCFMTNAQIERGDCDIPEPIEEDIKDDIIKEDVVIKEDIVEDKKDVDDIIFEDDDEILDTIPEEILEDEERDTLLEEDFIILEDKEVIVLTEEEFDDFIKTLEDEMVEFEEQIIILEDIEFDLEDIITEDVVEIPIPDEVVEDEPIKEDIPEVLVDDTTDKDLPPVEIEPEREEKELSEEEVEILVTEAEEEIKELVSIEIVEEEPIVTEGLSEEEIIEAEEEAQEIYEEAVAEAVAELPIEKKVEVVKEVAKVSVQNLANADKQTKAVVKAVVKEVTKVETVANLSEEQKTEVGQVLGFTEEEASSDLTIIAEQAVKDENTAKALDEFVERSIENKDVEDYTLADVVTEVKVDEFLDNPISAIVDVDLTDFNVSELGQDMTNDQREKSKEVVVPVIIASQIIASASVIPIRRIR